MTDLLPLLTTALTIIGTLAGAGVLLLKMNFKLGQQTLRAKQDLYAERFESLKIITGNLESELKTTRTELRKELAATKTQLHLTTCALNETKQTMVGYVESTERKMKAFETQIINLTNDLIFIKSKVKGQI
mgnify:CR=1 FL=1